MFRPVGEFFRIRSPIPTSYAILLGILPPILTLVIWAYFTAGDTPEQRRVSPAVLPSPTEVFESFPTLWAHRNADGVEELKLLRSIQYSLGRVTGGFLIGALMAVPLGIAMGAFTRVKHLFLPMAVICGYTPIAALVPLTMMWWGIEEKQKVFFLALATFTYLLPMMFKALEEVDDVYLETAATLGARTWQIVLRVMVPIAMGRIWNAMRLGFAIGWTYIILAEMVNAERGLGFLIINAQRRGPREHIFLVILVIAAAGYLIDKAFGTLGRKLFPHEAAT